MCINAKTSLIAFMLGSLSGLYLLTGNEENKIIGFYVIFYSLIQLFELNIYLQNNVELNSKLLLLNLGAQGLIFFMLLKRLYKIKLIYFIITGIIFSIFLLHILTNKIEKGTIDNCINSNASTVSTCIKWNFLTDNLSYALYLMYAIMIIWWYNNKKSTTFINKAGYFYILTFVIFYSYGNIKQKRPGYWCLSSAFLAPILLLFKE